jgi:hypothetical protein
MVLALEDDLADDGIDDDRAVTMQRAPVSMQAARLSAASAALRVLGASAPLAVLTAVVSTSLRVIRQRCLSLSLSLSLEMASLCGKRRGREGDGEGTMESAAEVLHESPSLALAAALALGDALGSLLAAGVRRRAEDVVLQALAPTLTHARLPRVAEPQSHTALSLPALHRGRPFRMLV